jgi:hypothetical protein
MKKYIYILLISCGSMYASPIKPAKVLIKTAEIDVMRTKCEIVKDNVYTFCVNRGFDKEQAINISNAAFKECNRVSEKK